MRILVADKLAQAGVDALAADHDVDVRTGLSKDELLEAVPGYDAIVVRSQTTIDADVIAAATDLKVVGRAGVGLDNVDIEAATRSGVVVCNAPQSNVVSAAEHTMALLLSLARNVPQAHAALVEGRWERSRWNGAELHDKTLGVLGLGRIGTLVAQRAHAFGMRLVAYDPFVAPDRAARLGVRLVDTVDDVLAEADFVTVHLPKTPETVGLFDAERLARMKPTARLLNVARGGIVVEADLAKALEDGVIAGAAIDVFDAEPKTDSPLFGLPNAIVTPHLGASTEEAQDRAGVQVAEAVGLALAGELVPSAVNVQGGPVPDAVKPFLPLAEKLGRLLAALAEEGLTGEVTVEAAGAIADEDTRIAALSVVRGLLSAVVSEPVTFVNAPLFAEERGLSVREISDPHSADYVSLLRVSGLTRDGRTVRVAGTVVQPGDRERLVEVWDTPVDVEPTDHMAFFRYEDRPGVIGAVGTGFGEAGVNIAAAQVGRREVGGEAIMALSLDAAVPREVLASLTERIGAVEGRSITLA
ncbi:phosphoglycerate dehydrogenase [Nitriliruptoraceae bacterium ZYF776]|nr:phosphoglycerate dehydrogenase [Profundirhabdus halotolerans]